MDRVAVFIDGNNFYNKLKDVGIRHTPKFDYRGLAEWRILSNRSLNASFYDKAEDALSASWRCVW